MRWPIYQAGLILQTSGVIAYPTETVWGLGCDPFDGAALTRIMSIKQRDAHKGLILVGANIEQFAFLLEGLAPELIEKIRTPSNRPTTWLVPHNGKVHPLVHGQFSTVAIRISSHPIVKTLCEQIGGPIVSTSANESGKPTLKNALQIQKFLGPKLDFILSGPLGSHQQASRIIDLHSGRIIRG